MKKIAGMSKKQFRQMVGKGKSYRKKIKRGIRYYMGGMRILEIVDPIEVRGWKYAQAVRVGRKAKSIRNNPYADPNKPSDMMSMCAEFFRVGFKQARK